MVAHYCGSTIIDRKGNTNVPTVICCAEKIVESSKEKMLVEVFDTTSYRKSTRCLFQLGSPRLSEMFKTYVLTLALEAQKRWYHSSS